MSIWWVGVSKAPWNSWSELSVGSGRGRWRGGVETPGARIGAAGQGG